MGLSTHILDTTRGRPAADVEIVLEKRGAGGWEPAGKGKTNDDGRVGAIIDPAKLEAAVYRISFGVAAYFERIGVHAFYPEVSIVFEVKNPAEHHHVPLLLNPFGYSTYRGS